MQVGRVPWEALLPCQEVSCRSWYGQQGGEVEVIPPLHRRWYGGSKRGEVEGAVEVVDVVEREADPK